MSACASLPSAEAARALVDGEPGALGPVLGTMVMRAGLIGAGAYVAGVRGAPLARAALGGALAIEVFVLGWIWRQRANG